MSGLLKAVSSWRRVCSCVPPVLRSHTPPTLTPGLPPPPFQEIGDVENWARSIELDMRTIATALEYVYKGQLQSAPS